MSTPRYHRPKAPQSWPRLSKLSPKQLGARLRQAISEAAKEVGAETVASQADWLGVAKKTVERWFRGANSPSIEQMRAIGQRTGVSLDWLLGFDVPRIRDERAQIGVLSAEIRDLLQKHLPDNAVEPQRYSTDDSHLAEHLVKSWWRTRLADRARDGANKLRELAYATGAEAKTLADPGAATEAQRVISQCLWQAGKLESPNVAWSDLTFASFPHRARQHYSAPGSPAYETPFVVTGGVAAYAFLWHGENCDIAVYLEPEPGDPASVGTLRVLQGSGGQPRFLRERTPDRADLESRATPVPPQAKAPGRKSPGRSRK